MDPWDVQKAVLHCSVTWGWLVHLPLPGVGGKIPLEFYTRKVGQSNPIPAQANAGLGQGTVGSNGTGMQDRSRNLK